MRIKTTMNAETFPKNYEVNTQPSLTVPDQTMSMREILSRYARGLPIDQKVPIYDQTEDIDMIDPKRLDLTERQELAQKFTEELQEIEIRKNQKQAKKQATNEPQDEKPED